MSYKNRAKVEATGGGVLDNFTLGTPIPSFTGFDNGETYYTALTDTGEWQVGKGTVAGVSLTRGTVEANHLGTTDQIDFTGKNLQIAQVLTADLINLTQTKLAGIEDNATADQTGAEIKSAYEGEADTNVFNDSYKNKLDSIEGNAAADQIASEVPFTDTADMFYADVQAALVGIQYNLNNHNQDADSIDYDPTDDPTSVFTDVQTALVDHGTSIEQRVAAATGIIAGGKIVIETGNTFTVEAGTGEFLDSYSDPSNTSIVEQAWDEFTGVSIAPEATSLTVATIKVFLATAGGVASVVKHVGQVSPEVFRDHIFLGVVFVDSGTISSVFPAPSVVKQTSTDVSDLLRHDADITDGFIFPVDSLLSVWQAAGTMFFPGSNWYGTNHKNPNFLTFSATSSEPHTGLEFDVMDQNGLIVATAQTVIPKNYDDGGVVTALSGKKATIHSLYSHGFSDAHRHFVLLLGQTRYDDADTASNNILQDVKVLPEEANNVTLIGLIGVGNNASDFSDNSKGWIVSGKNTGVVSSGSSGTTDHDALSNKDAVDQHPVTSIGDGTPEGQLTAHLASKMNWRNIWYPGTYEENDVVLDGGWTMVANQQTSEQPSPQDVGLPQYGMAVATSFTDLSDTSIITMVHRYTFTKEGYLDLVQIYTPHWNIDVVARIVIYDPVADSANIYSNPVLTTDDWITIALGSKLVSVDSVIEIYFEYYNSDFSEEINGDWTSNISAAAVPADKEYNISSADSDGTIVIDHTDIDSTEHTSELRGVAIGSIITLIESADIARSTEIEVTSVDQTATEVYSTFSYDFVAEGTKGPIRDGRVSAVAVHTPIAMPSEYAQVTDLYVAAGPTQPTFADVDTELYFDGVQQANVVDGYGINVRFQEATRSEHWDILANSGDAASSGSTGEDTAWGTILGDINSQTDLQDVLDTKEPLINTKNSAFNKDFGTTSDTVCEGDDSRLSDSRYPTTHNHNDLYYTETEVDGKINAIKKTEGLTPPVSPVQGQEWFNSDNGITYTWYWAGGPGQWVGELKG